VESNQTFVNREVPQGYSPAELPIRAKTGREWGPESAGSLTPFGMTISSFYACS